MIFHTYKVPNVSGEEEAPEP